MGKGVISFAPWWRNLTPPIMNNVHTVSCGTRGEDQQPVTTDIPVTTDSLWAGNMYTTEDQQPVTTDIPATTDSLWAWEHVYHRRSATCYYRHSYYNRLSVSMGTCIPQKISDLLLQTFLLQQTLCEHGNMYTTEDQQPVTTDIPTTTDSLWAWEHVYHRRSATCYYRHSYYNRLSVSMGTCIPQKISNLLLQTFLLQQTLCEHGNMYTTEDQQPVTTDIPATTDSLWAWEHVYHRRSATCYYRHSCYNRLSVSMGTCIPQKISDLLLQTFLLQQTLCEHGNMYTTEDQRPVTTDIPATTDSLWAGNMYTTEDQQPVTTDIPATTDSLWAGNMYTTEDQQPVTTDIPATTDSLWAGNMYTTEDQQPVTTDIPATTDSLWAWEHVYHRTSATCYYRHSCYKRLSVSREHVYHRRSATCYYRHSCYNRLSVSMGTCIPQKISNLLLQTFLLQQTLCEHGSFWLVLMCRYQKLWLLWAGKDGPCNRVIARIYKLGAQKLGVLFFKRGPRAECTQITAIYICIYSLK